MRERGNNFLPSAGTAPFVTCFNPCGGDIVGSSTDADGAESDRKSQFGVVNKSLQCHVRDSASSAAAAEEKEEKSEQWRRNKRRGEDEEEEEETTEKENPAMDSTSYRH